MIQIYDIKGYFSTDFKSCYKEDYRWEGQMIVLPNGWVEGIVKVPNEPSVDDMFIYGVYDEDKFIYLHRFTFNRAIRQSIIKGIKNGFGYDGSSQCLGGYSNEVYAKSYIMTRRNTSVNLKELEKRIDIFKDKMTQYRHMFSEYVEDVFNKELFKEAAIESFEMDTEYIDQYEEDSKSPKVLRRFNIDGTRLNVCFNLK